VPDRTEAWREILCVIEERTVGNDRGCPKECVSRFL